MKNISFTKNLLQQTEITETFFPPRHALERNSENLLLFLFLGTEFRVGFSSAEWFGREFQVFSSIFVPRNGIPSCFLLCGMVRIGIPTVFYSAKQPEFRWNIPIVPSSADNFLSEIANPNRKSRHSHIHSVFILNYNTL
jgi:hypothetical protein